MSFANLSIYLSVFLTGLYGGVGLFVDFPSFIRWVQKIKSEQDPEMNPLMRCIVIPTTNDGINLLLSLRELTDFEMMLESADSELTSLDMISMFKV